MKVIDLNGWTYDDHFASPGEGELHPVVDRVEDYIVRRDLGSHPFFARARASKAALEVWVSQELVMTNAFSQIVLAAASRIGNVHLRASLTEVAWGEHGRFRKGGAYKSHPWLLHRLRQSVRLVPSRVRPIQATRVLIDDLQRAIDVPIRAAAAIGVGNERLIVPEYTAIRECFEVMWPDAEFVPFLKANVTEDVVHARLCYEAASSMIRLGASADEYYEAAVASIESRWTYFDALLDHVDEGAAASHELVDT